jgi:peptidoglycan/LPS O-acetylase OafA/YrhL
MTRTPTNDLNRVIAGLMLLVALSLAVMSTLHLAGAIHGKKPYDPTGAGVAEAIIGIVLVAGGLALMRVPQRGSAPAVAAIVFAILGFALGLTFTIRGGTAVDIAYHATVLPVLGVTLLLLTGVSRRRQAARPPARRLPSEP